LAERVGFEPTAQPGSRLKACSNKAALAPLRFMQLLQRQRHWPATLLEKSCLRSIDHMDCSACGTGSKTELAPLPSPPAVLPRKKGVSTSAERITPLSVKRRNVFRFCWYRSPSCVHRDTRSPRLRVDCRHSGRGRCYSLKGVQNRRRVLSREHAWQKPVGSRLRGNQQ
jgi:hypothetical protein